MGLRSCLRFEMHASQNQLSCVTESQNQARRAAADGQGCVRAGEGVPQSPAQAAGLRRPFTRRTVRRQRLRMRCRCAKGRALAGGAGPDDRAQKHYRARMRVGGAVARARAACSLMWIADRRMRPGAPCLLAPRCKCRHTPVHTHKPVRSGGRGRACERHRAGARQCTKASGGCSGGAGVRRWARGHDGRANKIRSAL